MKDENLVVRAARMADLVQLNEHLPPPATEGDGAHLYRLEAQDKGDVVYLIALQESLPIGHVYLRWSGFTTPQFRVDFGGIPAINSLWVREECRSRGVGGALLDAVETAARGNGANAITLAVEDNKHNARRLYEKRGFAYWPNPPLDIEYRYPEDSSKSGVYVQKLWVMTKRLTDQA